MFQNSNIIHHFEVPPLITIEYIAIFQGPLIPRPPTIDPPQPYTLPGSAEKPKKKKVAKKTEEGYVFNKKETIETLNNEKNEKSVKKNRLAFAGLQVRLKKYRKTDGMAIGARSPVLKDRHDQPSHIRSPVFGPFISFIFDNLPDVFLCRVEKKTKKKAKTAVAATKTEEYGDMWLDEPSGTAENNVVGQAVDTIKVEKSLQ